MTDTEYEATRAKLIALSDKWLPMLGLKWWTVEFVYDREGTDFEPPCVARASVRWEYLQGTLLWNMPLIATNTDEELERVFVHECMHILLHETRAGTKCDCPFDLRHEERVASLLQKAFLWTWQMAHEAGEKAGHDGALVSHVPLIPHAVKQSVTLSVDANGRLIPTGA